MYKSKPTMWYLVITDVGERVKKREHSYNVGGMYTGTVSKEQ